MTSEMVLTINVGLTLLIAWMLFLTWRVRRSARQEAAWQHAATERMLDLLAAQSAPPPSPPWTVRDLEPIDVTEWRQ